MGALALNSSQKHWVTTLFSVMLHLFTPFGEAAAVSLMSSVLLYIFRSHCAGFIAKKTRLWRIFEQQFSARETFPFCFFIANFSTPHKSQNKQKKHREINIYRVTKIFKQWLYPLRKCFRPAKCFHSLNSLTVLNSKGVVSHWTYSTIDLSSAVWHNIWEKSFNLFKRKKLKQPEMKVLLCWPQIQLFFLINNTSSVCTVSLGSIIDYLGRCHIRDQWAKV